MSALHRKLLRDLAHMKSQLLAIALVMASGIAVLVMSLTTLGSLEHARATYYERYRFADVFAHLKRAPEALAWRLAEIPGVRRVETRIVADVTLDLADLAEPASGRLISMPEHGEPDLNRLHLRRGRWIEPGRSGEVLVSEAFADAHEFTSGDTIRAVLNGRLKTLRIVGVVLSPEYVYQLREGEIVPDDLRFGVLWMSRNDLEAAFDLEGAFNSVALLLSPGAIEADVIRRLDRLTEPYGGAGAFGRDDQHSNRYVSDEISQLRMMSMVAPTIFLSVAAFLLNLVLTRLISTQREQIAALKAFGYSDTEVGRHYLTMALAVTAVGVIIGVAAGAWLGRGMTEMYTAFFRFPVFDFRLDSRAILIAAVVAAAAATLGALAAVRRAASLPPAEAMRPEPPARYTATFIERIGLQRLMSHTARMIVRHLERRPLRAATAVLGIALSAAVLVVGAFTEDAVEYLIEHQFHLAQRQDMTIGFQEPRSLGALHEVKSMRGVIRAEPLRAVAARLRFGHRQHLQAVIGLPLGDTLQRIFDRHERRIELPSAGLVVSTALARQLGASAGDHVTLDVLEGQRPVRQVRIAALADDFIGTSALMSIDALNEIMMEGPTLSGAQVLIDQGHAAELYRELKDTPHVANVTLKTAAVDSFWQTIAETLLRMRLFNVIFATIIAVGVVYNSARISLSERSRELASLRVLGFTRGEISAILLGELALLVLIALPVGLSIGYGLAAMLARAMETETFRIPLVVDRSTFGFAAIVVIVAAVLSGLLVRRRLDHLDLVAVLKTRE